MTDEEIVCITNRLECLLESTSDRKERIKIRNELIELLNELFRREHEQECVGSIVARNNQGAKRAV